MRLVLLILGLGVAGLSSAGPVIPTKYKFESVSITDLGTLGNKSSSASDINESGDIVGTSGDASGKLHAVAWFNGGPIFDLHSNGSPAFTRAYGLGINDSRVVVGYYTEPGENGPDRAFRYTQGGLLTPLSGQNPAPHLPFDWKVHAFAINNSGRIVGEAYRIHNDVLPDPPIMEEICFEHLAVQWTPGVTGPSKLFCIADPDGNHQWDYGGGDGIQPMALDVNDLGNIVGTDGDSTPWSMFLYKDGQRIAVPPPATASNLTLDGRADGLNNQNWVVGTYGWPDGWPDRCAFVWDGVSPNSVCLGAFAGGTHSYASEINEQNMVVGSADRAYGTDIKRYAAFIWHADFGMKQLPGLEGQFGLSGGKWFWMYGECGAASLNDRKAASGLVQVVGHCVMDGQYHAVRWDITISLQPAFAVTP